VPKIRSFQPATPVPAGSFRQSASLRGFGNIKIPTAMHTPVCGRSVVDTPPDQRPSQFNSFYLRSQIMPYGRQMRGFGATPDSQVWGDTWSGQDGAVMEANEADDAVGNGIFDGPGAPPTSNAGAGVFEAHFGLPGYLYRERPGQPSEVLDTATGQPIIFMASPGNPPIQDFNEAYGPWDAETPRPYSRNPRFAPRQLPESPMAAGVPNIPIVQPLVSGQAVSGMGSYYAAQRPTVQQRSAAGFGGVSTTATSYLPFLLGGLVLGAAAAYAVHSFERK